MIENPFILRGYISDAYFCDREKETIDLIREIKNGNNITLIAPRRDTYPTLTSVIEKRKPST